MEAIGRWLNEAIFLPAIEYCLLQFIAAFNTSLGILTTEAAQTPVQFSATIVAALRSISNAAIMPVAGLLLSYIFCYELINMITEKNNMAEFDVQGLFFLIMRTTMAILLITNCFDITLAFFDVGQELVSSAVPHVGKIELSITGVMTALEDQIGENVGRGLIVLLFTSIAFIAGFLVCGLIYLVAWSRIVVILIYISVAPIPFATFMSKDWIGHIGQNYLRNLMALALQGFLMLICMVIYGGLVNNVAGVIAAEGPIMGIVAILMIMFVCVKSLMSCLSVAKSIFGAQ